MKYEPPYVDVTSDGLIRKIQLRNSYPLFATPAGGHCHLPEYLF